MNWPCILHKQCIRDLGTIERIKYQPWSFKQEAGPKLYEAESMLFTEESRQVSPSCG